MRAKLAARSPKLARCWSMLTPGCHLDDDYFVDLEVVVADHDGNALTTRAKKTSTTTTNNTSNINIQNNNNFNCNFKQNRRVENSKFFV